MSDFALYTVLNPQKDIVEIWSCTCTTRMKHIGNNIEKSILVYLELEEGALIVFNLSIS